jgi:hypothetical protein
VVLVATSMGEAEISGPDQPVTLAETLPAGLTATAVVANVGGTVEMSCRLASLRCSTSGTIAPYHRLEMLITVTAPSQPAPAGVSAAASVSAAKRFSARRPPPAPAGSQTPTA